MEFNYNKCPECGYVNNNQPDVCPSCGCDLKEYRDELHAKEQAYEAAEQARKVAEQARAAELAEKSYSFICDTMEGMTKTEDVNKNFLLSFIAAFADGSSVAQYESDAERYTCLLTAIYRYYNDKGGKRDSNGYYNASGCIVEAHYSAMLDLMGRYISSSQNNRLKSTIDFLTPSYGIKCFFELIITELEFGTTGKSPFSNIAYDNYWLGSIVTTFIYRFKEDIELSVDDELNNIVEQYIIHLSNSYEVFSDWCMEDFNIDEEEDDGYENWTMNCPHCDAAIKLTTVKQTDKIKCAECGKAFMFNYNMYCPECGAPDIADHPFGINQAVCGTCGLKYEVVFTDPDDDTGAIESVLYSEEP